MDDGLIYAINAINVMGKTVISSVAVIDITGPVAGAALDKEAVCQTIGVDSMTVVWTDGISEINGNADYNTVYTASITLSPSYAYVFSDTVTATINGKTETKITYNSDGTITITHDFPATCKDKLISITAPQPVTVANKTAYGDMNLPTTVNIVTEGNTMTNAAVAWNTTTPASVKTYHYSNSRYKWKHFSKWCGGWSRCGGSHKLHIYEYYNRPYDRSNL